MLGGSTAGLGLIALKQLEEDQNTDQEKFFKIAKKDLVDLATVRDTVTTDAPEVLPTVYVDPYNDKNGLARTIQTVLDSMKIQTTYSDTVNAPRFTRVKLEHHIGAKLPSFEEISRKLHTGLVRYDLKNPPIISIDRGYLAVDIPKNEFKPIGYQELKPIIRNLVTGANQIVIGLNTNYEIISQPVNQFQAFTVIGGKSRSGKSNWLKQTAAQILVNDPKALAYLVEFKEGTFKYLEGCKQIFDQSVGYAVDTAGYYIDSLYNELLTRIETGRNLRGKEYQDWWNSLNYHHLFFDEYRDDPAYVWKLEQIFSKAAAYKITCFLATQRLNKTSNNKGATVSGAILANSHAKICFAVDDNVNSFQIIGNHEGTKLLGFGDMFYKSDLNLEMERLQAVFYSDSDIEELVSNLEFVSSPVEKTFIPDVPVIPQQSDFNEDEETEEIPESIPETWQSQVLKIVETSGKPVSIDFIARKIPGYSRKGQQIYEFLEQALQEKLVRKQKSANGKGYVYSKF